MPASLVVQTSFIGDVILTTPLIARLAEAGPVDVVTTPVGASVLRNNPFVRSLVVYDKRGKDRGITGFAKVAIQTRGDRKKAYLAQGSLRSAAFARVAGCRERIGFNTSAGRTLYTQRVEYRSDWHHARRLLSLAGMAFAEQASADVLRPCVYPRHDDIHAVDALWNVRTRSVIALAPGSVWATKRWPYYAELAQMLARRFDVAIVGGAEDRALAQQIVAAAGTTRAIDATGKLSLLGSAELIRRSIAIVTNDSAPQHLASAVGTPTVSIFGPTVPDFGFGPLAVGSVTVGHETLACRPCHAHGPQRCPLGHWKCMQDVSAETMYAAVMNVIHEGVAP